MKTINNKRPQKECVFEYPDTIVYRTTCDCQYEKHSLEFEISRDKKDKMTSFIIYTNLSSRIYDRSLKELWKQIKQRFLFLFKGHLEISTEFIFRNEDHIEEIGELMLNWKKELDDNTDSNTG